MKATKAGPRGKGRKVRKKEREGKKEDL